MHEYLKGSKKNDQTPVKWTDEAVASFLKTKELSNSAMLYPEEQYPPALFTDASDNAMGGVIQQFQNNQ